MAKVVDEETTKLEDTIEVDAGTEDRTLLGELRVIGNTDDVHVEETGPVPGVIRIAKAVPAVAPPIVPDWAFK